IKASNLIVGEKASVKGEIMCERVTIRGKVEGGIRAKQVSLAATAHILGDIVHSQLSVETGAHFEGACRHSDDPLSEAASNDFRKQRPSPPPAAARPAPPAEPQAAGMAPASDNASANGAAPASDTPSFLSPNRSPLR
ncbi:MAG: polymer-forming cytoskeletal protein, partial [Pseudomonadota bacterium]